MGEETRRAGRWTWRRVASALVFIIVAVFGSLTSFSQYILDLLNFHPSYSQVIQYTALGVGILGLVIVVAGGFRKPEGQFSDRMTTVDYFEARILKDVIELGENVFFDASFNGFVRHGFFFARIVRPDGEEFYAFDPETFGSPRAETRGSLSGKIEMEDWYRWSRYIPTNTPRGYTLLT